MEGYKPYTVAIQPIFKKYGARYVTRGGRSENVEGENRSRNVIIEFPDYDCGARLLSLAGVSGSEETAHFVLCRRHRDRRRL